MGGGGWTYLFVLMDQWISTTPPTPQNIPDFKNDPCTLGNFVNAVKSDKSFFVFLDLYFGYCHAA